MLNRLEHAGLHGQRIGDGEERALVLQANALVDSVKAVVAAEQIRGAMKDPDSFRLTNAFIVAADQPESGASCFEYRSRSSFNGVCHGPYSDNSLTLAAFALLAHMSVTDSRSEEACQSSRNTEAGRILVKVEVCNGRFGSRNGAGF
jgi:hypothetical protein